MVENETKSVSDVIPYLASTAGENLAGLIPIAGESYLGAKLMTPALEEISAEATAKYLSSNAGKKALKEAGGDLTEKEIRKNIKGLIFYTIVIKM